MTIYNEERPNTNAERRAAQIDASYGNNRDAYDAQPFRADQDVRSGYRPGWVWIPLAVLFLLIVLVIGTGFVFGGYNDSMRAYDSGTLIENRDGPITQPSLATPQADAAPPEIGNQQRTGEEPSSLPEAAPPLANDGQ
jgi:hypothetical protein